MSDKKISVVDEGNKSDSTSSTTGAKKSQNGSLLNSIKDEDTADEPVTKTGKIDVAKADAAIVAAKKPIEHKPKKKRA